jgi:hypothetical protein
LTAVTVETPRGAAEVIAPPVIVGGKQAILWLVA